MQGSVLPRRVESLKKLAESGVSEYQVEQL